MPHTYSIILGKDVEFLYNAKTFFMIKLIISYYKDKTKSMFYSYGRKYKI